MQSIEKNSKYFSIVIPTMWKSDLTTDLIYKYNSSELIKEIIIIDNNPTERKSFPRTSKIKIITNDKNNFVNPSWNLGYTLSKYKVILSNDDIKIDNLEKILTLLNETKYDVVGVQINSNKSDIYIEEFNQEPTNNFGCFLYVKKYTYIPEMYKIWAGDNFLIDNSEKVGILINSTISTTKSETLKKMNDLRVNVAENDRKLYLNRKTETFKKNKKILFVLVNFGDEQLNYLEQVVCEIKKFKKYETKIVLHSNILTNIQGIDETKVFDKLDDYQLLPLTCRRTIWENREDYDIFVYGENDHLFKEHHIDKHLEYSNILPENRLSGLIQYEQNDEGLFYPAYHAHYEWDFSSVEIYDNKVFAHFTNLHQATFILTKKQLIKIGSEYDFTKFFQESNYSKKCKVNTDLYQFTTYKKMICISEFKENLIHHLPNLYIYGDKGRRKNQRSDDDRMKFSLLKLLGYRIESVNKINKNENYELSIVIPTFNNTEYFMDCLNSVVTSISNYNCEILVGIDNCRKTYDLIKDKVFDSRVKFFFFEKNYGPYIVKNTLGLESNSEKILFFDSDDIMLKKMVYEVSVKLDFFDFVKPMYYDFHHKYNNENLPINTNKFGEGVFGIRKSIFLEMNGFEPWRCAADSEFMSRLYKNGKKFHFTKEILFLRRIHNNSLTMAYETSSSSSLRAHYFKLANNKTNFGPLMKMEIGDFTYLEIKKNTELIDYNYKFNKTNRLKLLNELINGSSKESKSVDYSSMSGILNKESYNPQVSNKIRVNTPNKEKEFFNPKEDSNSRTTQQLSNIKPNRRKNSPNIFGSKKK